MHTSWLVLFGTLGEFSTLSPERWISSLWFLQALLSILVTAALSDHFLLQICRSTVLHLCHCSLVRSLSAIWGFLGCLKYSCWSLMVFFLLVNLSLIFSASALWVLLTVTMAASFTSFVHVSFMLGCHLSTCCLEHWFFVWVLNCPPSSPLINITYLQYCSSHLFCFALISFL